MKQVKNILDTSFPKKEEDNLHILTAVAHERYEQNLTKIPNTEFWSLQGPNIRTWNTKYASIPDNYHILDRNKEYNQIPPWIEMDIVICHNFFAHHDLISSFTENSLPVINVWHILPPQLIQIPSNILEFGHHVFISEFNQKIWGFPYRDNVSVIHHGIDTDFWQPSNSIERQNFALSVCNDWINRDKYCGYSVWEAGIKAQNIPHYVIGDTPSLSLPANNLEELRAAYQNASVFVNTSLWSPIPMSLLEAMACGCAPISADTCMIPDIINHGINGYLFDPSKPEELALLTKDLLKNPEKAREVGYNARETILNNFSMATFIDLWNKLIRKVIT